MSVLGRLASALGRNDEQPNVELAEALAAAPDAGAVAELVAALDGKSAIANDAIKVLYELGERRPELVALYAEEFIDKLGSRNNRLVWGALTAIDTVTAIRADDVIVSLDTVLAAADAGSVIAKDKANAILVKLAAAGHGEQVLPILLSRLGDAAPNQFPTYAEAIGTVIDAAHKAKFIEVLGARLPGVDGNAKRARVEKLLKRLRK
jgi:hypothetical protein